MSNLQRRLAAEILKIGQSRVWMNPVNKKDIEKAITKWDVRKLIKKGDIKALPPHVKVSVPKKKTKRGHGSKKGKKFAIVHKKRRWINTVRPQRRLLMELKSSGQLAHDDYRKLYKLVKGGMFRSRSHLKLHMEQNKMLKVGK